jgi:hypothetical protein
MECASLSAPRLWGEEAAATRLGPALAGTHSSAFSRADEWIPAFAGT